MADEQVFDLHSELGELRRLIAELTERVSRLEASPQTARAKSGAARAGRKTDRAGGGTAADPIPAGDLIAIAAAIAAYLGARAQVRQVRLISSSSWAQQGRVSIQGSHRLER